MSKYLDFSIILFLSLLLISCFKHKMIEKYDNGTIKLKCKIKNGIRDGECLEYYPSGNLKSKSFWKDNKLEGKSFDYFENGQVKEMTEYQNGLAHGADLTYSQDGKISEIGQFYRGKAIGYFARYHQYHLYHIRQYTIVNDESIVNQYWGFDNCGNLDKSYSKFFSLGADKTDTLKLDEDVTIIIKMDAPYFINGGMKLIIGNYNDFYVLKDSLNVDTIVCKDFYGEYRTKFQKLGKNYIRGIVRNYLDTIENNQHIIYAQDMYFEKRFIVKK